MRIAVYGGSFNPPHVGHGLVAAWLQWIDGVDQVWLVPTFAHAFDKELAPFSARLSLCQALAGTVGPWVHVCSIEEELARPSYTIDTLCTLQSRYPEHEFRLVVGADVLEQTDAWKQWGRIQGEFNPIVVGRQGWPTPAGALDFPGVSSTVVRDRVRNGESVEHLVPVAVRRLLGDLYKSGPKPTTP